MISTYKHKNITWLDLQNPTIQEIKSLSEKYSLDDRVANDLLSPTMRPYTNMHGDYIYTILHFPSLDKKDVEIDFVIGKDFLITNRYENYESILEFSKIFEVDSILDKSNMSKHAGFVFFYMLKHFYHDLFNHAESIKSKLRVIEENIYHGKQKQMVIPLSEINRDLIHLKSSLSLHEEILKNFMPSAEKFFDAEFGYYLENILGEYLKVQNELKNLKEYTNELKETNDSLLTTKQNEIMKNLTIISFIVLPLSLISALFQMNAESTPIVGSENDFIKIFSLMIFTLIATFSFLKYKKWF